MLSLDVGYAQGMSDLCAPLYIVFEADEAVTFFAFVKLMDRMVRPNHHRLYMSVSISQRLLLCYELYSHAGETDVPHDVGARH